LNQEDKNNLNRSISNNETEAVMKNLPTKSPGLDGFTAEFYQNFKALTPVLLKLFNKIERQRTLPNSYSKLVLHGHQTR
jgi:hypothetical protein